MQVSGLPPALEKSHALLCVSRGVLGCEAWPQSHSRLKLNRLAVGRMPSLPLPDAERLEDFAKIVGTKPGSNVCLNTESSRILMGDYFSISNLLHTLNSVFLTLRISLLRACTNYCVQYTRRFILLSSPLSSPSILSYPLLFPPLPSSPLPCITLPSPLLPSLPLILHPQRPTTRS